MIKTTRWTFWLKEVKLGMPADICSWHEITHEKAQDIFYQSGAHRAAPHIKRLMYDITSMIRIGNYLIKMEEYPCQ